MWKYESPRITPACAGKSTPSLAVFGLHRDHPRVCGEKRTRQAVWTQCGGSPPRVRGKADYTPVVDVRVRITPACAGKRGFLISEGFLIRDHPRVCGEKSLSK